MVFEVCLNLVMERLTLGQSLLPPEVQTFAEELVATLWNGIAPL